MMKSAAECYERQYQTKHFAFCSTFEEMVKEMNFLNIIKQINPQSILVPVICNNRVTGKFYQAGHRPDNPAVDSKDICEGQQLNLYLISQTTSQRASQHTILRYCIQIQLKLKMMLKYLHINYVYYNFVGPIKIPESVRYAHQKQR